MSLQPHCGQVKKYGWLVGKVMIHSPFLLNNLQRVFVDAPAAAGAGVSVVSMIVPLQYKKIMHRQHWACAG